MLMLTNSKAKYALDLLVRSGETAERWLARAGLFDSVNLNNTIAKNAIVLRPRLRCRGHVIYASDVIYACGHPSRRLIPAGPGSSG
jgi:hypothetical protein